MGESDGSPVAGVFDCPVLRPKKGVAMVNAHALMDSLSEFCAQCDHAFIERAQFMPGQGGSSAFNYGTGFGIYLGVLAALEIPYSMVAASVWKKFFHLAGPDKEASRATAIRLVPSLAPDLARKKDHGRAEAILICLYGMAKMSHPVPS